MSIEHLHHKINKLEHENKALKEIVCELTGMCSRLPAIENSRDELLQALSVASGVIFFEKVGSIKAYLAVIRKAEKLKEKNNGTVQSEPHK